MGFLSGISPVTAVLLADTKEYSAKMDEAAAKMEALGGVADTTGGKFTNFANKASSLVIGAGVAIGAVGVDLAIKFQTALDQVQNTTNATAGTIDKISKSATNLSNNTTSSATAIVTAYGAVEAAGYKWADAEDTVTAATKLAQITHQDVLTTTQALIAARSIGITKGMSEAKVADTLTIALKGNEQGLQGVVGLLQGKVGTAFKGYNQSFGEALVVSNIFSQAQFTNSRAISAVIAKVGALQGPLKTTTDTNGKLSVSTASWVDALNNVGLNALKTRAAFAGPDGLINGLRYLKTTADGSLPKLEQYLTAIGGSAGVGPLTLLVNHLGQAKTLIDQTGKASGQGLNTAFNLSQKDVDNQMEELKNKAENILRGIGMFLLPGVTDLARFSETAIKFFDSHPLVKKIASDSAIGLFGAAVAYKIFNGLKSAFLGIKSIFSGSAITANTTATQENTDALLGRTPGGGGTGVIGDAENDSKLGPVIGVAAASAALWYLTHKDPGAVSGPTGISNVARNSTEPVPHNGPGTPGHKGLVWEPVGGPTSAYGVWVTPAALKEFDLQNAGGSHPGRGKKPGKISIKHTASVKVH